MSDEIPLDPPTSKDFAQRVAGLRSLSVNPFYQELIDYIKGQHKSIMESVFVSPTSVEGILARERCFGVAEEYEVLLSWLENQISDAEAQYEQLKLEETLKKEHTQHEG